MNYFTKRNKVWLIQMDRHGVEPFEEIEVARTDGSTVKKIVRRVVSKSLPEGDLVLPCPDGTPPVKRIPLPKDNG